MGLFEEMNQVLRSPSFRGCLESVLGEDMMVACCEYCRRGGGWSSVWRE